MITDSFPAMQFKHRLEPRDHQERIFLLSRSLKAYALLWEMGLGKTKVIIDTAAWLFLQGEIDGLIVISDNGVYRNWVDEEVPIHMMEGLPYRMATYSSQMNQKERRGLDKICEAQDNVLDILAMNVEGFSSEKQIEAANRFMASHYCLAVVDESTSIKSMDSKRAIALRQLGRAADYRRIMTGTPIANSPLDIFGQFEFLGSRLLEHDSFVAFRSEYASLMLMDMGRGKRFYKVVGYKSLDKLARVLQPHSSRLLKSECLDLPEKIYMTRYVEHTPEQRKAYDSIRELALAELDAGMVTVTSAITALGKLQQINCGHVKLDDKTVVEIPSNRIHELLRICDILGDKKVIIWAHFRHDIIMIMDELWKKYGLYCAVDYFGDTTADRRQANIKNFRTNPDCRFFVSNPATGGKGITLIEASDTIYYSNSMSPEDRLQSEDRCHRIGQGNACTYTDLVTRGTVDVKILSTLKAKKDLSSEVLDVYRSMLSLLPD